MRSAFGVQSFTLAGTFGVGAGELVGQQLQEVAWAGFVGLGRRQGHGLPDGLAEELHLAPQVILQRPAHEVLQRLVPRAALRHVEHARLQVGDDVGAEGEVLVHPLKRDVDMLLL